MSINNQVNAFLAAHKKYYPNTEDLIFETSIRVTPGKINKNGRMIIWKDGTDSSEYQPVYHFLEHLNAPQEVLSAQKTHREGGRQGVSISSTDKGSDYRLYVKPKATKTKKADYIRWRWSENGLLDESNYYFHFLPETSDGLRIQDVIPKAAQRLLDNSLLNRVSGFWLRYNTQNELDQVYLTYPWFPRVKSLPELTSVLDNMGINGDLRASIDDMPIRHIATKINGEMPSLTLYSHAKLSQPLPTKEEEYQKYIFKNARNISRDIEHHILNNVPKVTDSLKESVEDANEYPAELLQLVFGKKMQNHYGFFLNGSDDPKEDSQQAFDQAIIDLFLHLPKQGKIYEIGCNWGNVLSNISTALDCKLLRI